MYRNRKRKLRLRRTRRKGYKILSLIAAVAIVAQAVYPIIPFLPSFGGKNPVAFANDNILATGDTEKVMFQNTNPEFKVEFGNKEQAEKPFVRFEALGSGENPFAKERNKEIKAGILERLASAIYGEKEHGIEFGLREAGTKIESPMSGVRPPAERAGSPESNANANDNSSPSYQGGEAEGVSNETMKQSSNPSPSLTNRNLIDDLTEKAVGGWEKAQNSTQSEVRSPEYNRIDPSTRPSDSLRITNNAQNETVLEAQAELEAEEKILDMLNEQLDAMIKDANWRPAEAIDVDKKREELKKQILADLMAKKEIGRASCRERV